MADQPRMARERRTIAAMIRIYCRRHHGSGGELCDQCDALLDYALCRLDRCPYGQDKPTCATCPVHCYASQLRERIRAVMRFAGSGTAPATRKTRNSSWLNPLSGAGLTGGFPGSLPLSYQIQLAEGWIVAKNQPHSQV